ncbi:hypothetical protein DICPUDRAFT_98640 [Dictyostelium purpureum]|uniref:Methyltransferase type 12 domain-containing protein n=1 Tax=Dictyostelium purpureum TaxID=5786 RepID=F0ZSA0_DICPU|nr:uncharacterized protein DICPUDRAFT_98640 [Dictyostelium purpureum]EGC33171.1 hypothetical protein DICPUDRAFT_98640 [Dictyostelium purpureum]|eukprot:XP_003290291.1 hypothetical protein DICPUDRAFT_98640 [Dictyostelium purpureum]
MKIFTNYYENNVSVLESPVLLKEIFSKYELPPYSDQTLKSYENAISFLLFQSLNKRNQAITDNLIENNDIPKLKNLLLNENQLNNNTLNLTFEFMFETIKRTKPYYFDNVEKILDVPFISLFEKSSKILSKKLFPKEDDDQTKEIPEDLFDDEYMEDFYSNSPKYLQMVSLIGQSVKKCIEPLLFKKQVLRIIEFGGGTGTTSKVICNEIMNLLEKYKSSNENSNILLEIEYTYSDVNPILIENAKKEFKNFDNENCKMVFRNLNIQKSLESQGINHNYYDIVVVENVLHFLKDAEYSIKQVHLILKGNGHFILYESPYRSVVLDSVYGAFDFWWDCSGDYRIDRCIPPQKNWINLLEKYNFKDMVKTNDLESLPYIIQSKKVDNNEEMEFNQIIVYGELNTDLKNQFFNLIMQTKHHEILNITNTSQFKEVKINDNSTIFYIPTIEELIIEEIIKNSDDYNYINQYLINNNHLNTKHIIVSTLSAKESNKYLNSSIIGLMGFWLNSNCFLKLYNFDFDLESLNTKSPLLNCFKYLHCNQLIIRENQICNEKYKKEQLAIQQSNESILNQVYLFIGDVPEKIANQSNIEKYPLNFNDFKEEEFLNQFSNYNNLTFIFTQNENHTLEQSIQDVKLLIKLNNLSIDNKISFNNFIIESFEGSCSMNSNSLNSILESISSYRRSCNKVSLFVYNQNLTPISDQVVSSPNQLNHNVYNIDQIECVSRVKKNKMGFYFNEIYCSSNTKNEIIDIIKKIFNTCNIENYNQTLNENFKLSCSSNKIQHFKESIDNEILKDSISLEQVNSFSIESIINTIYIQQLKNFEFFRKKTK